MYLFTILIFVTTNISLFNSKIFIFSTLLFPMSVFFKLSRTGQLVFNNLYKLGKPSMVFDRLLVLSDVQRFSKVVSDKIYLTITFRISDIREDQVETN